MPFLVSESNSIIIIEYPGIVRVFPVDIFFNFSKCQRVSILKEKLQNVKPVIDSLVNSSFLANSSNQSNQSKMAKKLQKT